MLGRGKIGWGGGGTKQACDTKAACVLALILHVDIYIYIYIPIRRGSYRIMILVFAYIFCKNFKEIGF